MGLKSDGTVVAIGDAPVAGPDARTIAEDSSLAVVAPGVLSNDTDADGDTLTADLVTSTSHGTLVLSADGSYTYAPDANWSGTDTFTYRAFDGAAYSAPATVTITVNSMADPTALTVGTASKTLAKYGSDYTFAGTLSSGTTVLAGKSVVLQVASSSTGTFADTSLVAITSATGAFTFTVVPRSLTYYRARFAGEADEYTAATSASRYAKPRHYVSTPKAPKTMSRTKYYTVYGYMKPKHTSGTKPVKIKCYKKNSAGVYKYHHSVYAKVSKYSTYSKYKASVKLPHGGKWRLRAYASTDSKHAYDYSGYDYVTVK